jgi:type III restriction enzyme
MELKDYQQSVINDLVRYLAILQQHKGFYAQAFTHFWATHPYFSRTETYRDTLEGIPHLCLKVPTAGGKTYLACNALQPLFEGLRIYENRLVVWFVPSTAILEQTYNNLSNPKHFYHQRLRQQFGKSVEVYQIDDLLEGRGFSPVSVRENVNILVLSYQSIRADKQTKDNRRIYKNNGCLMNFFENETDKSYQLVLSNSANTSNSDTDSEVEAKSLINVIRKYNPVCVIDEAHNATSDLSVEMLKNINPCFVLELTATPRKDKANKKNPEANLSNILSYIDSFSLKKENMVKLPLLVNNLKDKHEVLERAMLLQFELEEKAKQSSDYIRPIVLVQAQAVSKEKETETYSKLKENLIEKGIPAKQIAIKTANIDEIKNINLLDKKCEIRYIITVDALKEGWDCPFAYILATVANKSSEIQIEQIVGRVLRKPYTKNQEGKALRMLNMSYVLTSSPKFQDVLDNIVKALNHQGFAKTDIEKLETPTQNTVFLGNSGNNLGSSDANAEENTNYSTNSGENNHENSNNSNQSYQENNNENTSYVYEAEAIYEKDKGFMQLQILQNVVPIPADLKNTAKLNEMKPQFKAIAEKILLPQFFITTPKISVFDVEKEVKLDYENLLTNFDLKNQSIAIDFDSIAIDLYEVDIEAGEVGEKNQSRFVRSKATEYMQELYLKAFSQQTNEGKVKTLTANLIKYMGNVPPFEDVDLKNYVRRIVESRNIEELENINSKQDEYAQKIKKHIQILAIEYAEKKFYELIDKDKIYLKPNFALPTHTTNKENTAIKKCLFEKAPIMTTLESQFISDIASLENVVFGHKFTNRGKEGFCINACFTNHYPDFLIVTKNNKYILAETKGDYLLNQETATKNKMGRKWASLAGRDYKYFMIFETLDIPDCYNLNNIKNLIKDL